MAKAMQLVYIEWVDSNGFNGGWRSISEVREAHGAADCFSVGWLAAEDDKAVTLVSHISGSIEEPRSSNHDLTIPKCAIVRRRVIRNYDGRK